MGGVEKKRLVFIRIADHTSNSIFQKKKRVRFLALLCTKYLGLSLPS